MWLALIPINDGALLGVCNGGRRLPPFLCLATVSGAKLGGRFLRGRVPIRIQGIPAE